MKRILILLLIPGLALAQGVAVDGDTVRLDGGLIRLAGIDAPELRTPRCDAEATLARQARDRLAELIAGPVTVEPARGHDRYGRLLAIVRDAAGQDVGQVLIAEGLAVPYHGHGPRQDWCASP